MEIYDNTIMIKTDLTPGSLNNLDYAINLAIDLKKALLLLFINTPELYNLCLREKTGYALPAFDQKEREQIKEQCEVNMKKFIKRVKKTYRNAPPINYFIEDGQITEKIISVANMKKADMVIFNNMKEEAGSRLYNSYYTSVEMIVKSLECPVLIMPENHDYRKFNNIVYLTDNREEDFLVLKKLSSLFSPFNPEIIAMNICENVDFELAISSMGFQKMIRTKTGNNKIRVRTVKNENGNFFGYMEKINSEYKADLIVLLKEYGSFIEWIFNPDPVKNILKDSGMPVMLYSENINS